MQESAKMTFSYPLALSATADADVAGKEDVDLRPGADRADKRLSRAGLQG
jgi:hypothetical protein